MSKHQLIAAEVSLYSGKVRAYLHYKRISFDEVTATREVYRDVIVPRTGVRFIPVFITDDDVAIQDSTAIIDYLEQRYPSGGIYPAGPLQRLVALLFEVYGDEWLIIPAMHYRWNVPENRAFAIAQFGQLSAPDATPEEQLEIGEKLSAPFAGALPALGISEATVPAIEQSYLSFLAELDAHLSLFPYLLGTRPSIGDFGLFGPLYAHLERDPASGRLMRERAPKVVEWVERMKRPRPLSGAFLFDDFVPPTLEPLLRRMFREQGPVLLSTIARVASWSRTEPRLPRSLGTHTFALGDTHGERAVFPFNLWRWQRPYDQYRQLTGEAQARAKQLLANTGGLALLETEIVQRVARAENRLQLA